MHVNYIFRLLPYVFDYVMRACLSDTADRLMSIRACDNAEEGAVALKTCMNVN